MATNVPLAPLAAAGIGALFLWSGLKGAKISTGARSLLAGQQPSGANVNPVTSASFTSTAGTVGLAGGGTVHARAPGGPGQTAFFTAVLASIGALPTAANLRSMNAWYAHEEPSWPPFCTYNPLNTELRLAGFSGICPTTSAVATYSSPVAGVAATAVSIMRLAPDVAAALRTGRGLCGRSFSGLSSWSGGGYSSVC